MSSHRIIDEHIYSPEFVKDEKGVNHKSYFERLVIAKMYIKKLLFDIGVLQSERDEAIDLANKNKLNYDAHIKLTTNEKKAIRKEEMYNHLRSSIKSKNAKIKKLEKDKRDLIMELIKLKEKAGLI